MKKKSKNKKKEKGPEYCLSATNTLMRNYKEYYLKKTEFLCYVMIAFAAGGIAGWIFYGNLFLKDGEATFLTTVSNILVCGGFGFFAAKVFLPLRAETLRKKRQEQLKMQFRELLSSLNASFSSGANIVTAFENANKDMDSQYGQKAFITQETMEIMNGMQNNVSIDEVLENFGTRSGLEDVRDFATVFQICYQKGGDMKSVVRNTYDLIGDKIAIQDEIATKLTSNKMQQNIMSVAPIVMIGFLRLSSSSFAASFASFQGVITMTVAIGIFAGSYMYGRKIVNIKG